MVLGGGGYTVQNVAKCWAYETACLLGREIEDEIPADDEFKEVYGARGKLFWLVRRGFIFRQPNQLIIIIQNR